ncbi:MAG: Fmu (Sun) domain-containing protein [Candidatus Aramenus sulfurataquae]|uniref:tRNA (cytosine(72)-C(5))-methyltransferase n=1 Tax=Candidatus Aramenus sulfurataquae TaxID=1326980 RepID=W7KK71_9CREN|nr:MAG: Fmu (Sun) domain-containing protein [Candidatus Aramenus sulfurataquae]
MELDYDEFVMEDLKEVYGDYLKDFLEALSRPNPRLYLRVNTLKTTREELLERLPQFKPDEDFPEAIYVPVTGPNKLEMRDSYVVVDKKTAESVMLGANVYRPGVKKIVAKGKEVSVVSENGVLVGEGVLVNSPTGIVVEVTRSLYSSVKVGELSEVKEGLVYSQGKASMHVARLLDPQPGETIVDMTASPGGKLTHVYQLEPRVRLIGLDHSEKKVERMRRLLTVMGVKAELYVKDSRYAKDLGFKDVDKVLIDPPCSALGVRPKVYDRKTKRDIMVLHDYQRQFLNSAYEILKKGGIVIYSTCTVTTWENEKVIEHPGFEVEFALRLHPHLQETTGFFIAKLIKK